MSITRVLGLCLCVFALSVRPAAAADGPSVGVVAGVNVASASLSGSDATNISTGHKAGLYAGAFVLWPLGGMLAIQPELALSQKHFSVKDTVGTFSATEKWNWIELPILARLTFWHRADNSLFVIAGPGIAFRASAKEGSSDVKDDVQSTDVSVIGGAGIVHGKAGLEIRYDGGVKDLNKDHRLGDLLTVKSRAVTFNLMWRF
jgi:hypothetical protein